MNKRQLFGRKEQMLKSQDKLDSGETLDGSDWELLLYLVNNRIYSKWKLRLCVRLLDALGKIYFNDDPGRGPADEEARSAARAVISSKYMMERLEWRNRCEQKAAQGSVSQIGTRAYLER